MWLYVPGCTSSRSALAEADLISASSWQFKVLERSAWWRGKRSLSRNWYRRWDRVSWVRALCGAMPEPSTGERGVALWMASLAASRASRIATPANGSAVMTSATFGPPRAASSSKPARGLRSSRMFPALSRPRVGSSEFGESFIDLVSRLRLDCSLRRRSAPRTSASASLSWPSPRVWDSEGGPDLRQSERAGSGGPSLRTASAMWPTPSAALTNDQEEPETFLARAELLKEAGINGNGAGIPLTIAVKMWPTPQSRDYKGVDRQKVDRGKPLNEVAAHWRTPTASEDKRGVPTEIGTKAGEHSLARQASLWATPRSHEVGNYQYSRGDKSKPVATLTGQVLSRPALPSSIDGKPSSTSRRVLNPLFVEWLMGWPPGWTDFVCSATALCRFRQLMRSELLQLGLPAEVPAQRSLFG